MDNTDRNIKRRLSISISFSNNEEDIYKHASNHPNTSYYVKDLIKRDIEKSKQKSNDNNQILMVDEVVESMLDW